MSKLIIKNKKIKVEENIKNLVILKNKLILKEDITQNIDTKAAASMITDTLKTSGKIGESIIKNHLSNIKFLISISLLPLTKNLDNVIKSYETEIKDSNKILLDSIPQNVINTNNFITLSNSPSIVFEKMSENFEKIEGVKQIINSKNINSIILPDNVQKIFNNITGKGQNVTAGIFDIVLKDLPSYFKTDRSLYSSVKQRSIGSTLSGKTLQVDDNDERILTDIINSIIDLLSNPYTPPTSGICYNSNAAESEFISNVMSILQVLTVGNSIQWNTSLAVAPYNTDVITRHSLSTIHGGTGKFVIIQKPQPNIVRDNLRNCYICLDTNSHQTTHQRNFIDAFGIQLSPSTP